jgi:hypothetical protein
MSAPAVQETAEVDPGESVEDDQPTVDERRIDQELAFRMLSCRRRRHVLHYLRQNDGAATLRTLSRKIAAWENDIAPDDITYQQRVRVYTALRQSHLPKMDDGGIVEFDPDRSTVALTDAATQLDVYLDVVPHDDIPWSSYYAGLGALCVGFGALVIVGLPPFSILAGGLGALLFSALFFVSGIAHVLHDRRMHVGTEGPPQG